jgi:tetraacyldisaccharide 4'-kinase
VKLEPLWPREAPPLWYLSQSVVVERGAEVLDRVLTRVLTARTATAPTAG